MINIIQITPVLNYHNNGFIYLCLADDGNTYVRSVSGKWAQLVQTMATPAELQTDLTTYLGGNVLDTLITVRNDNTNQNSNPTHPHG